MKILGVWLETKTFQLKTKVVFGLKMFGFQIFQLRGFFVSFFVCYLVVMGFFASKKGTRFLCFLSVQILHLNMA